MTYVIFVFTYFQKSETVSHILFLQLFWIPYNNLLRLYSWHPCPSEQARLDANSWLLSTYINSSITNSAICGHMVKCIPTSQRRWHHYSCFVFYLCPVTPSFDYSRFVYVPEKNMGEMGCILKIKGQGTIQSTHWSYSSMSH